MNRKSSLLLYPDNYVKRVIDRILSFEEDQRQRYLDLLLTLADLRPIIKEKILSLDKEAKNMPIVLTKRLIKKNPVYKMGLEEGEKRGMSEAKKEAIVKLYTKKGFTISEIADILDLPIEFVENTLKEKGFLK